MAGDNPPKFVQPDEYLTIKQVQKLLGISKHGVQILIDRGELSEARVPGVHKRKLIPRKSLHRYVYRMGIKLVFDNPDKEGEQ
jgi:excisionase family DNA binding protein